jgi:FAD/FMN-containing dehydrogenase
MNDCRPGHHFQNWDGTISSNPSLFCQPDSEQKVSDIVSRAEKEGKVVRTTGAGHSWSNFVLTDDYLVNLDHLDKLLNVDAKLKRVKVQGGIRLKNLIPLLAKQGLGMKNTGSILEQSIAGAISTGTHGTGIGFGNISTQAVGFSIVTGAGSVRVIDNTAADRTLLRAARVSIGCLGIITQVTLQCVDHYSLEFSAYAWTFSEVLSVLDTLIAENDRVRIYWFAPTDLMLVMTMNALGKPRGILGKATNGPFSVIGAVLETVAVETAGLLGLLRSVGIKPEHKECTLIWRCTAPYDRVLTIPVPPKHQECEYAVSMDQATSALKSFHDLVANHQFTFTLPVEIRFVAQDDSMLSTSNGTDVCYIGAYTHGTEAASELFAAFEPLMKQYGGRPHWGKHLSLTSDEVKAMYREWGDFVGIRKDLDPKGTFANMPVKVLFS